MLCNEYGRLDNCNDIKTALLEYGYKDVFTELVTLKNYNNILDSIEKIYFNKSNQLWNSLNSKKSIESNVEYARLNSCLGCLEDNHQLAEEHFLKALQIYENSSENQNHDYYVSQVSEYLAERYFYQGQFENALTFLCKTIHLRQKYLSTLDEQISLLKS
ncbi:unnamed protein product [Adineta ricciae]|uniref:Tetratricopeptide repeat protein n=1 Tax=Adineta ricciae TaxID=249248 RepID=A0A815XKR0_ADIRI|nr:unnamed protein product [Adineta ricciae]